MSKRESTEGNGSGEEGKRRKVENGERRPMGYFAHRKGEREDMQDRHVILDEFDWAKLAGAGEDAGEGSSGDMSFYAVYDGHGGDRAAQYASEHLHLELAKRLKPLLKEGENTLNERELKRTLLECFKHVDDAFLRHATQQRPVWKDGCTATIALCVNSVLYVANIGDSRAVLCRHKEEEGRDAAFSLTKDHSPTVFEERQRIERAGGTVKDGRVMGALEVSRAFGDGPYKAYGVSCLPDVRRISVTKQDKYLLIACDGLWKAFPVSKEALTFVAKERGKGKNWQEITDELAAEAVRRMSGDNVTVLLVVLQ